MRLTLDDRLAALDAALEAGGDRLPAPLVDEARTLSSRVRERVGLSAEHTVVVVAGGTGSGKSSLVNALLGEQVAATGVERPTTSHPLGVVVGARPDAPDVARLLDWLEVDRRHAAASGPADGLVLLDLPDHDSVVVEHRLRAERLVARTDLLVWAVDPQKYADAALHERYLRPLAGRDDVVVLALNQADRLSPPQARAVADDLRRLVVADGLTRARVLTVSARTGDGVDELRALVGDAVRRREATNQRFGADLRAVARAVADACGTPGKARRVPTGELVDALEDVAGVPAVVAAVRGAAVRQTTARTGWPPVRWLARLRPDPLRRLHLTPRPTVQAEAVRTSLPVAGPVQRARAATAVRDHVDAVLAGAPDAWVLAGRDRVGAVDLADALDLAVVRTPLLPERAPWGWRAVGALQWLLLAAAVAGALWLAGLALLAWLRLPEPTTPVWGPAPAPTVLLLGGVAAGLLVALLGGVVARLDARRRARAARRRLRAAVTRVATELVVEPLRVETQALATCRSQAARAASG